MRFLGTAVRRSDAFERAETPILFVVVDFAASAGGRDGKFTAGNRKTRNRLNAVKLACDVERTVADENISLVAFGLVACTDGVAAACEIERAARDFNAVLAPDGVVLAVDGKNTAADLQVVLAVNTLVEVRFDRKSTAALDLQVVLAVNDRRGIFDVFPFGHRPVAVVGKGAVTAVGEDEDGFFSRFFNINGCGIVGMNVDRIQVKLDFFVGVGRIDQDMTVGKRAFYRIASRPGYGENVVFEGNAVTVDRGIRIV